jgi:isopenicillin N synthase-like dioxygenase
MEKITVSSGSTPAAIPVIDISNKEKLQETASCLRQACIHVGFFYLEGHGVSQALLEKTMEQSRKLFNLSLKSKESIKDSVMSRGYTAMEEETLDPARQSKGDTKEGFYIGPEIAPMDPRYSPEKLSGPNCWPTTTNTHGEWTEQDCQEFQKTMEEYYDKMSGVGFRVTQLLAMALELDVHYFDNFFQEPMGFVRLLHYASETSQPDQGVFACGAHSDYGMITLLLTDSNPGLQINFKGEWIDAPPRPNAFVVNLGDMLERWSNGLFKSTKHRVLTSGDAERYSIPFFYDPAFDTEVKCLPTCCSSDNPAKYPIITSGQHLLNKYQETHADFQPES